MRARQHVLPGGPASESLRAESRQHDAAASAGPALVLPGSSSREQASQCTGERERAEGESEPVSTDLRRHGRGSGLLLLLLLLVLLY